MARSAMSTGDDPHIQTARYYLQLWAEWLLSGAGVTSAIGYPCCTVEARMAEGALTGGRPAGNIVPTRITGVRESRTNSIITSMPDYLRLAIEYKYCWTCTNDDPPKRVTDDMRARRWGKKTGNGQSRVRFNQVLDLAEHRLAGSLMVSVT